MNTPQPWMLYGAAGHTGTMLARRAVANGHRPVLVGRNESALATLAQELDLEYRVVSLDDAAGLSEMLAEVGLVLNAAGPFLRTAVRLAEACIDARVHYLDIGNELQVFLALNELHDRAQQADVAIIPGVGFGTVITNCLARYVSDAIGGAERLEVATRVASAQPGPGAAATMAENLPYGGWVRSNGQLVAQELFTGITTIEFPDGTCEAMPVPTGDLEAAFKATGASDVIAYAANPPFADPPVSDQSGATAGTCRSFGWARATGSDGSTEEAWLETGESYAFTAAASVRAVEETLAGTQRGTFGPATAFGADFVLTVEHTTRMRSTPANT